MPSEYEERMDNNLADWSTIAGSERWNLLLGNGFSQNISRKFGYSTLYEVACDSATNPGLSHDARALFEALDTKNFEEVLQHLVFATRVAGVFEADDFSRCLSAAQKDVRESLISAIHRVHVSPEEFRRRGRKKAVREYLASCGQIFTTNYDLIPYWAIMAKPDGEGFGDFFWNSGGAFDSLNTNVREGKVPIYYLHGALHIFRDDYGITSKVTCDESSLILDQVADRIRSGQVPLIVSEGSSAHKLKAIRSSEYLNFAYHELANSEGRLAIFGHSLNREFDGHLTKALSGSDWDQRPIAISVHPDHTRDIIAFKHDMKALLPRAKLKFFDSTTHPLGDASLQTDT